MEFRLLGQLATDADGRNLTPARPKQRALVARPLIDANELVPTDDLIEALWSFFARIESRLPPGRFALFGGFTWRGIRRIIDGLKRDLPSGTVTFLFTDIEGSTRLLHDLGPDAYADALAEHRRVLREAFAGHGGVEVDTQGDAFFVAFPTAPGALAAAEEVARSLTGAVRVRIGIHTGAPLLTEEGYVGADVHRAARIAACGHGGQILVSSSTAALLGRAGLRDLGQHRLKDLSAPERIYQVADGDFPPLKSLHLTNLPVPTTPFLGREKELGEVLALLSLDDLRLLTLTGPGGTGKTRLAAQAAGVASERYPHGVWWIPLAPLRDPTLVVETAAQTVGAQDGLADHIADKSMLLLFDNFEHLVEAAGEVGDLLRACPNLELLVTSREPLHISGEQEYAVPPFVHEESVGFFLARARAIDPAFQVDDAVSEICQRVDDLPLAIELAAARVKALSAREILDRLEQRLPLLTGGARDLPERQRTLRATIEWSYELLTLEERQLFARLAVFRGGCTLDAAEAVAGGDLDTLQSLLDKSLLRHSGERFWMLETIREYAADRLDDLGETEATEQRHANHFVGVAEDADTHYQGGAKVWLDALTAEHDNFRAAFERLETVGETQLLLRLAGALWRFWNIRGHVTEGRRQLEQALRLGTEPTPARAKALNGATVMALESGDPTTARAAAEEALANSKAHGDRWAIANSTFLLGMVDAVANDFESGRDRFTDALRVFREIGDEHYILLTIRNLAWMHFELGDIARARELHGEVVRQASAAGNKRLEQTSLGALAEYALYEERLDEAIQKLKRAFELNFELGEFREIATNICRLAHACARMHKPLTAARLLGTAEAFHEAAGAQLYAFGAGINKETEAIIKQELDEDAYAVAVRSGRSLTAEAAVRTVLAELGD